ncbi:MAG: hypothetical protein V3R25_03325 [Nitrosomonadaceae bacterium]
MQFDSQTLMAIRKKINLYQKIGSKKRLIAPIGQCGAFIVAFSSLVGRKVDNPIRFFGGEMLKVEFRVERQFSWLAQF